MPPNGPELSCGDEVPQPTESSPREISPVDSSWLFRACKIVDAGSVSLSDWLGGKVSWLTCTQLRTKNGFVFDFGYKQAPTMIAW